MRSSLFVVAARYLVAIFAAAVSAFPILWLLSVALMERKDLFQTPPRPTFEPTLDHVRQAFVTEGATKELVVTLLCCLGSASCAVAAATLFLLIYRIANNRFPNVDGYLFPAVAIPGSVLAIPFFFYTKTLGLGPIISFLGGVTANGLIISMLVLSGFLRDIQRSNVESLHIYRGKQVLGNAWILATDARSSLLVAFLFAFLAAWHDLATGIVTAGLGFKSLNVSIIGLITPVGTYWGEIAARSVPSVLLAVTFALVANDRILRGFSFGR